MPEGYALHVDIVHDADDAELPIRVTHTFWGLTEAEARENFAAHARSCEYLQAAIRDDKTIEELEEDAELPEIDDDEDDEDG